MSDCTCVYVTSCDVTYLRPGGDDPLDPVTGTTVTFLARLGPLLFVTSLGREDVSVSIQYLMLGFTQNSSRLEAWSANPVTLQLQ